MVGLVAALLSTAACTTDPDIKPDGPLPQAGTETVGYPIWQFCAENASHTKDYSEDSLRAYANYSEAIFTGKVIERRLVLNKIYSHPFNGCWVQLRVNEVLKGTLDKYVWVNYTYDERTNREEYGTYKNCFFSAGSDYLITGKHIPSGEPMSDGTMKDVHGWIGYVAANKDVSEKPRYICSPVEKLPEGNHVVVKIKKILGE